MIPSTAPPFAMTRWTAQTDENYVSVTPYNHTHTSIHGFQVQLFPCTSSPLCSFCYSLRLRTSLQSGWASLAR